MAPHPLLTCSQSVVIVVAFLLLNWALQPGQGQLSAQCRHASEDYAWNEVMEAVPVGYSTDDDSGGIFFLNKGGETLCARELSTRKMIIHPAEEGDAVSGTCQAIFKAVNVSALQKMPGFRFMIPFGTVFYVGSNYGTTVEHLPGHLNLNVQFNHPNIDKWVQRYVAPKDIEAVALVKTTDEFPSFPSVLLAIRDNQVQRIVKFMKVDPKKLPTGGGDVSRGNDGQVGHIQQRIEAIYLADHRYNDNLTTVLFFGNYYARWVAPVDEESMKQNKLREFHPFPILPAQGVFGCPVHLCWWPVLDDMMYHEGAYYFFQGQWMFVLTEGSKSSANSLASKEVYDLRRFGITFIVYGATYDYELKRVILIRRVKASDYRMVSVVITKADQAGKVTLQLEHTFVGKLFLEDGIDHVYSAVHLNATPPVLWLTVRKKGKLFMIGFKLHSREVGGQKRFEYTSMYRITEIGHESVTALFYHPAYGNLFLISGFFLYIYQKVAMNLKASKCSVTYANRFFNCTEEYYNINKMDPKNCFFQSKAEYFQAAEDHHLGEFLPQQCNFFPNMSLDRIPFMDKIIIEPHERFVWKILRLLAYVGGGLLLGVLLFNLIASRQWRRKKASHRSTERHQQERKLAEYIKQTMRLKKLKSNLSLKSHSRRITTSKGASTSSQSGGKSSSSSREKGKSKSRKKEKSHSNSRSTSKSAPLQRPNSPEPSKVTPKVGSKIVQSP